MLFILYYIVLIYIVELGLCNDFYEYYINIKFYIRIIIVNLIFFGIYLLIIVLFIKYVFRIYYLFR